MDTHLSSVKFSLKLHIVQFAILPMHLVYNIDVPPKYCTFSDFDTTHAHHLCYPFAQNFQPNGWRFWFLGGYTI